MNDTMTAAVDTLIHPWTDVVQSGAVRGYQAVDHEPLLTMLRTAIRSSSGRTASGRSDDAARNIINLQAFELWESIARDVLMFTRRHTRDNPNPILPTAIGNLAAHVDTLWTNHQITETDRAHLIRKAEGWRDRIWELFDPPTELELTEPCPTCEQRYVHNAEGEQQSALIVTHKQSKQPVARCRSCGYLWEGEAQLVILGRMIGAEIDTAALEEMGSDINLRTGTVSMSAGKTIDELLAETAREENR